MRRTLLAVVALGLVAGCGQQRSSGAPPGEPGGAAAAPTADDSPQAVTLRAVERVLASARLPSGSRPATAREADGKELQATPDDTNLVDRHATYVVPLDLQDAVTWFEGHPPSHLRSNGTSSIGGGDGLDSAGVEYTEHSTRDYQGLTAEVAVYPLDDTHAVVRVDGLAEWLPRRTAEERVPGAAHAVHVIRVGGIGGTPQVFLLRGRDERALAHLVNRLRPTSGGLYNCPKDDGAEDVLHFTGATPDPTFRVAASGCGFVAVRADGVTQPALGGGIAVDRELSRILRDRRATRSGR